jgi:hypothetical protein
MTSAGPTTAGWQGGGLSVLIAIPLVEIAEVVEDASESVA